MRMSSCGMCQAASGRPGRRGCPAGRSSNPRGGARRSHRCTTPSAPLPACGEGKVGLSGGKAGVIYCVSAHTFVFPRFGPAGLSSGNKLMLVGTLTPSLCCPQCGSPCSAPPHPFSALPAPPPCIVLASPCPAPHLIPAPPCPALPPCHLTSPHLTTPPPGGSSSPHTSHLLQRRVHLHDHCLGASLECIQRGGGRSSFE